MRAGYSTLLLAIGVFALAGCTDAPPAAPLTNVVASLTISAPAPSLVVGGTLQLTGSAANATGAIIGGQAIAWVSSRPDIATISSDGLVSGVTPGVAVITASAGGKSAFVSLSVRGSNLIVIRGDAGDYFASGLEYRYSNADAQMQVSGTASSITLAITGDQRWNATFQVPSGSPLVAGTYASATRWPFQGTGAGLSWTGEGRGCNTLTGSFVIDSLRWSAGVGSTLLGLDLRFEQHCEGVQAALHGNIHWSADDPLIPPGPVRPVPSGLWQPPDGAIPTTGSLVYISDEDNNLGGGPTALYRVGLVVGSSGRHLSVSAGGWQAEFEGMSSIGLVETGLYNHVTRYPFHNPAFGGISWSGNGSGCNRLDGWFAVDRARYVNTDLLAFELRFALYCDAYRTPIRGYIRWGEFGG